MCLVAKTIKVRWHLATLLVWVAFYHHQIRKEGFRPNSGVLSMSAMWWVHSTQRHQHVTMLYPFWHQWAKWAAPPCWRRPGSIWLPHSSDRRIVVYATLFLLEGISNTFNICGCLQVLFMARVSLELPGPTLVGEFVKFFSSASWTCMSWKQTLNKSN